MNNFKKCPIKKRPVVYEVEDDVQIIEDVPQDLSLKRKAEDECSSSSSNAKKNNFALNLSSNSFYDKMQQQANTSVWFIEDTTRRPESPVSPSSDSSVRRETSVSPVAGPEYNNIHLRGLTSVQRNQSESLINHYGMNYYWPRYQHEDGHSEISYNLTPPSSPSSSEPEDLSVKSYIPLPALLYHDIRSTYEEKSKECHRFKCEKCGKSYSTITGLSKHTQFHCPAAECNQVKKTFSCKSCDKVYTSLGALKMHIRTHTLPCKCPICGKAFSRPWLLQGHIRTHTGEKPFTCDHCHRAFADRSNLRAHQQTHVEVKKYICECCQKSFSRMSLLNKHTQGGCSVQSY